MVKLKNHSKAGYKNGNLGIDVGYLDEFEVSKLVYEQMREDLGQVRWRSEIEVLSPKHLRTVKETFRK